MEHGVRSNLEHRRSPESSWGLRHHTLQALKKNKSDQNPVQIVQDQTCSNTEACTVLLASLTEPAKSLMTSGCHGVMLTHCAEHMLQETW